ncbi:DEAD/DEAH box helicase [Arthrobacter pigmenti]
MLRKDTGSVASELLPTKQATGLVQGLTDYLSTTFALSDPNAQRQISKFLQDQDNGMFKGPYVRLRLPFAAAEEDVSSILDTYTSDFAPYGHQAAAFKRLSSKGNAPELFRRPEPTLVTTGTGSGKTESFLYPIIDHVVRAQKAGIRGVKALILYPMNALANDQAQRLTDILQHPDLAGIRAGIYTGQRGASKRTVMSAAGLINDRHTFRDNPPDILLTNYKMLDMLLLRHDDSPIWSQSATSLHYVVLDEVHTYDGAQGTDVAMLLRRLGATLKSHWPSDLDALPYGPKDDDRRRPLGTITPVATSATLGVSKAASNDHEGGELETPMLAFAQTLFGERFGHDAVITESRLDAEEWCIHGPPGPVGMGSGRFAPRPLDDVVHRIRQTNQDLADNQATEHVLETVVNELFESSGQPPLCWADEDRTTENIDLLLAAIREHPITPLLIERARNAVALTDLAETVFPARTLPDGTTTSDAEELLSHVLVLFSHVRAVAGRTALTVETHLWVRELSRIDAALDITHDFRWSDDGVGEPDLDNLRVYLPAIFCRHCGRNGWGGLMAPTGTELIMDSHQIRQASAQGNGDFRAMLYGTNEAEEAFRQRNAGADNPEIEGLRYLHTANHTLSAELTDDDESDFRNGLIIPVLVHTGSGANELSEKDTCPSCHAPDAIRFIGSAIATLLSVSVSNLFGTAELNDDEKKALVFTDSVQDAAHRAGFIQARSHTFSLRTVLHNALQGAEIASLTELTARAMHAADSATGSEARYQLVPPELADRDTFKPFWNSTAAAKATPAGRRRGRDLVRKRLAFDAALEFGLQSRLGRTLELTGTVVVETEAGSDAQMIATARRVVADHLKASLFAYEEMTDDQLIAWIRGVLVRIRAQGGISHPWLRKYIRRDGNRWNIWGGRPRDEGMPAFPSGRPAPVFPKIGGSGTDSNFDSVLGRSTWYSRWTARCLSVANDDAGYLIKALFDELTDDGVLDVDRSESGASVFSLSPDRVLLSTPAEQDLAAGAHTLECDVCQARTFGTHTVIRQLRAAPCLMVRCPGHLHQATVDETNFYRNLYASTNAKRVVAHEHSSLLDDETRVRVETEFKAGAGNPEAPNVLVATPTLEMGIDIGDLSTVMLASMPTSVASYVQRVGRAGRLTGNSLVMAFVKGRGQHLPKLNDPLSVIGGDVRPPATYLDAEEILARQFLAYLADRLAQDRTAPHPGMAPDALRSIEPGTFLGTLVEEIEKHGAEHVQAFLGQFEAVDASDLITNEGQQRLRDWVLGNGRDTAPIVGKLSEASRLWNQDVEEVSRRITDMDTLIPSLRADLDETERLNDEHSSVVTDARRSLRSALGALKRMRKHRNDQLLGQYWISLLEAYGLFPNYTLIGDSVQLDVGLSWRNEETQEFEAEVLTYDRSASAALREFAPGSTFYAGGLEIKIDAVDLGSEQRDLEQWQVCPNCGWVNKDFDELVPTCPRCGASNINDTGQVLDVAVLRKVSAEIRRDESVISDRRDERNRTSFHIVPVADIDRRNVTDRWFVTDFDFGIEYLAAVDIRWLNLGEKGRHGTSTAIAGHDIAAPLFRLCSYCGQQDKSAKANSTGEHRFWCKYRKSTEEHTQSLALAYELTTQAVLMHLPVEATVSDDFALPTLKAALLLGLQESLGGTPSHLGVIDVPATGASRGVPGGTALLLHDTVPGGTGYLAEFTNAESVHRLLRAAWEIVRRCSCQNSDRLACHECLLPHADHGTEDQVSRAAAERLLGALLSGRKAVGRSADEEFTPEYTDWDVSNEMPQRQVDGESHLELRFRQTLIEQLETLGATLRQKDVQGRRTLQFKLPSQKFYWFLEEQVDLHGTRPDFVLRRHGADLQIAIYTDGRRYHASPMNNRIADDALKRQRLREVDIIPWAITSADLDRFTTASPGASLPPWFEPKFVDAMMQKHALPPALRRALGGGSMSLLWEWILDPEHDGWRKFADAVPLFLVNDRPMALQGPDDLASVRPSLPSAGLCALLNGGEDDGVKWWHRQIDHLFIAASGRPDRPASTRAVLAIDDRPDALFDENHATAWQHWLLLSNLLSFKTTGATILSVRSFDELATMLLPSAGQEVPASAPAGSEEHDTTRGLGAVDISLGPGWLEILNQAIDDTERDLFIEFARTAGLPLPEVGAEISGWPVTLAWEEQRVAVVLDEDGNDELKAAGWHVINGAETDVAGRAAKLLDVATDSDEGEQ